MAIDLATWLDPIRREYLDSFIPAGGGAVRMLSGDPEAVAAAIRSITAAAAGAGLRTVAIDTASTRLNMLQFLVFELAAALDWTTMIQSRAEALVQDAGYRWPTPGQRLSWPALAEANGVTVQLLRPTVQQQITRTVWDDGALAQDFRRAMIALLGAHLDGDPLGQWDAVTGWLSGTLKSVRALREAQIGARIGRANARAILVSLCHWIRRCGLPGCLVTLDIGQLLLERRAIHAGLAYTPAAVMDCYEVIRQVIDDAEHLHGLFLLVTAGPALIDGSTPKRDLGAYTALNMRVSNDVRPHGRDNPLAPLVVLAA